MKTIVLLTLLCWRATAPANAQTSTDWQVLAQGNLASVSVERRLYMRPEHKGFFVHLRICSKAKANFSIDWRDRYKLFYPNQWSTHSGPARDLIDEERMTPAKVTPELKQKLIADFQAGALTPVGSHLDYYREFFGKGPEDKDLLGQHYLIVSMDGQLFFTDGGTVESLSLGWDNGKGPKDTDLIVPLPISWIPLPVGAKVFED